jgi:hypothetical protein
MPTHLFACIIYKLSSELNTKKYVNIDTKLLCISHKEDIQKVSGAFTRVSCLLTSGRIKNKWKHLNTKIEKDANKVADDNVI